MVGDALSWLGGGRTWILAVSPLWGLWWPFCDEMRWEVLIFLLYCDESTISGESVVFVQWWKIVRVLGRRFSVHALENGRIGTCRAPPIQAMSLPPYQTNRHSTPRSTPTANPNHNLQSTFHNPQCFPPRAPSSPPSTATPPPLSASTRPPTGPPTASRPTTPTRPRRPQTSPKRMQFPPRRPATATCRFRKCRRTRSGSGRCRRRIGRGRGRAARRNGHRL